MRAAAVLAGIVALGFGVLWALTSDVAVIRFGSLLAIVAALVGGAIASRSMRESLAESMPPVARLASAGFHLQVRLIALTIIGIVAAVVIAEAIERATLPRGALADHVERLTPRVVELPPIRAAQALEREFPAEDQHYTPWGVFLRYERDVVALLPRTAGTSVERLPDEQAYERYGYVLGRFWGPAYHDSPAGIREGGSRVIPHASGRG